MIGAYIKKCAYQTMGAVLCSLLGIYIYSGGLLMSHTIKQLSQMDGRVYVFFRTDDLYLIDVVCHSDMDFNVTEIKQSLSLFQLPVLLNLRKTFIDLTN